ncbi:MAG: ribosome assembly RNA-binding protein YhbY [Betaproteobacteria bacterium]|nr:ribosome assembly RNA-binding protein YhbY [Betaproteobacteria bacterium]NBO44469.1 ribosome assembly RNA-binding protein YhbY [Betaproteobacteria bacterium]NBP10869.1 ribosome assembly RNA-binding protein YhbY [Betaproteobacteria bacterium]NBP62252.1 ribosome assembly RNA-binding protein YhbY [Betaproteobacteria bacterium]NBQ09930.1 ribosome assembly RNA-binding protein YhbY [Betaproteobacteria bacterium]
MNQRTTKSIKRSSPGESSKGRKPSSPSGKLAAKNTGRQKKSLGNLAETAQGRARNALLIDRQLDGNPQASTLILSTAERKALKAAAHHLDPVVIIGQEGLSEAVIRETDRSLKAHALIKVRVAGDDRETRQAMLEALCETLACAPVQSIGKLLVLYRPKDYS